MTAETIPGWHRGDVVAITDKAHRSAICVLTTGHLINDSGPGAWLLIDDTCLNWMTTDWVEARSPVLMLRAGAQPYLVDTETHTAVAS